MKSEPMAKLTDDGRLVVGRWSLAPEAIVAIKHDTGRHYVYLAVGTPNNLIEFDEEHGRALEAAWGEWRRAHVQAP